MQSSSETKLIIYHRTQQASEHCNLEQFVSDSASVCHADLDDHCVSIAIDEFTQQANVAINQFEDQSQSVHLFALTMTIFHHLTTAQQSTNTPHLMNLLSLTATKH